jgi:hypothetical protein
MLSLASWLADLADLLCRLATNLAYGRSGRVYIVERFGERDD